MNSATSKKFDSYPMLGKVVLITGAGSGIGAAVSINFASLGAYLSICDKNSDTLKATAEQCASVGQSTPLTITADISIDSDVKKVIDSTIAHYSKLNILVNNAGIVEVGSIETTSLAQFDRVFAVNVRAMYHLTMLAAPHLIISKGNIVNVSSIAAIKSFSNFQVYCMSKSAVDQFTKILALELGPKQVRVNSVNPGTILTNLCRNGGFSKEEFQEILKITKETYPLKRPGDPEEVANAIVFLSSDKASFITGVNLLVDGGYLV